ncbi:5778_t:CDS:2 [Entrophospora sp. SA101]|nr:5778_t:CDS:2 [Entrophospora sp. SA101]
MLNKGIEVSYVTVLWHLEGIGYKKNLPRAGYFSQLELALQTDSSESNSYNCPQKKKSKADHYTTASGESKLGLKLEELTNMIKKSLSDAEDNMHMTVSAKKHPIRKRKVKGKISWRLANA